MKVLKIIVVIIAVCWFTGLVYLFWTADIVFTQPYKYGQVTWLRDILFPWYFNVGLMMALCGMLLFNKHIKDGTP